MRGVAIAAAALVISAAAGAEEGGKPRLDPKDLEIQVLRLKDTSTSTREKACRTIGAWGAPAKSALPALAPLLGDPEKEVRRAAAFALLRMGTEAAGEADRLAAAMKDEDAGVRANAALALEAAGARSGRGALAKAMKDADPAVRANAAAALGGLGADDLAALAPALRDAEVPVRANAAWALGMAKGKARSAVAPLSRALSDGSEVVRAMAARALGRIGEDDDMAVPALVKALDAEIDRRTETKTPEAKGPPAPPADAVLAERIEKQGGARRNMAWALGRFKANAKDAKAVLARLQEGDPNPVARSAAKTALERTDVTVMPAALEEQPQEFPPVPGQPWKMAIAGGSVAVVFRHER